MTACFGTYIEFLDPYERHRFTYPHTPRIVVVDEVVGFWETSVHNGTSSTPMEVHATSVEQLPYGQLEWCVILISSLIVDQTTDNHYTAKVPARRRWQSSKGKWTGCRRTTCSP